MSVMVGISNIDAVRGGKDPARLGGHGTLGTKERTKEGRRSDSSCSDIHEN